MLYYYCPVHGNSEAQLQIVDWGGRGRFKLGPFLYTSAKAMQKSLMFLHHANNIEHNLKQNIYTGMEVISFLPP